MNFTNMTLKKNIFVLFGILLLFGIIYGIYEWNKPMRDVSDEKAISISANALYNDYVMDEAASNTKYLNKALEVNGKVTDVKKNDAGATFVILQSADPMFGVNCTFKDEPTGIAVGQTITIKGFCTAYLDDVIINQAILINQ